MPTRYYQGSMGVLRFKLFGFPVQVHPLFWLVAYLLVSAKQGREMTRMEAATSALVDRLLIASDAHQAAQRGGTAGAR